MYILLVEDDIDLCEAVQYALLKEGHTVDVCNDGNEGYQWILQRKHDLLLLDRMLPGMNGDEIIRKARENGVAVPTLMITALGSVDERVEGLDAGADDYIVKPIAVKELLARVRAAGRRAPAWEETTLLEYGDTTLDTAKRLLNTAHESVPLSPREATLLEVLMKHAGNVVSRDTLYSHIWGSSGEVEEGTLDSYIRFARRRLNLSRSSLEIVTIRYSGYCIQEKKVNESV